MANTGPDNIVASAPAQPVGAQQGETPGKHPSAAGDNIQVVNRNTNYGNGATQTNES